MANSEDTDQTPRSAASDLDLHCLPLPICSNTLGYYGKLDSEVLILVPKEGGFD